MLDERIVSSARFGDSLERRRDETGLSEVEFGKFSLILVGVTFLASSLRHREIDGASSAERQLARLGSAAHARDTSEFESEWFETVSMLVNRFDRDRPMHPQVNSTVDAFLQVSRELDLLMSRGPAVDELLLACFDELHHRHMQRQFGPRYRGRDAVTMLCTILSNSFDQTCELFPTGGELAASRSSLLGLPSRSLIPFGASADFFLRLRYDLHQVRVDQFADASNWQSCSARGTIHLVDHPERNTTRRPVRTVLAGDNHSAFGALLSHYMAIPEGSMVVAVISGSDRTASTWKESARRGFVETGMLRAVVDLPKHRGRPGNQASAWILGPKRTMPRPVLMIDAAGLAASGALRDSYSLMSFVAEALVRHDPEDWPLGRATRRDFLDDSDSESMISAHFADGLQDMAHFVRRVRAEDIAQAKAVLSAKTYLASEKAKQHGAFIPLISPEPIAAELRLADFQKRQIYLIGNNGEGKSLLLCDIAEKLNEQGVRVVAVPFGVGDRFRFEVPRLSDQLFCYIGNRTSERGTTLSKRSADIDSMVREVHTDANRLKVFDLIVQQLGFHGRRYMLPPEAVSTFDGMDARYGEIIELSNSAAQNDATLRAHSSKRYVLGLMREGRSSAIAQFNDLSSGEQQLLVLALKLTCYASPGCVFLLDEPELSLHVNWQRAIPEVLRTVAEAFSCAAVTATHSPIIISGATHRGDICYASRSHVLTKLDMERSGSVDSALFDSFQTYTVNNRQVHERCAAVMGDAIRAFNSWPRQSSGYNEHLSEFVAEIDEVERIILAADRSQMQEAGLDLELVKRTRAALHEMQSIRREMNQ